MKKRCLTLIAMLAAFAISLSSCEKYASHYNATAFVHSNESDSAFMSFWKFEGTMVFKLKYESADEALAWSAKLETGSATVYYDCGDGKTELCALNAGDETESTLEKLKPGTVYVIVESDRHCENGDFHFDIK